MQGCNILPRDIDIIVGEPYDVYYILELVMDLLPSKCEYPPIYENTRHIDINWVSSKEFPVISDHQDPWGYTWVFTRWMINEIKVEVAHITPPAGYYEATKGKGIWEAGAEIWPHIRKIPFQGYQVPVVPLEIQLETNLSRNLDDRINEIIRVFKQRGFDKDLIAKALSPKHLEEFKVLINSKIS